MKSTLFLKLNTLYVTYLIFIHN